MARFTGSGFLLTLIFAWLFLQGEPCAGDSGNGAGLAMGGLRTR